MGYPIYHSQYTAAQIEASIGKTPRIKAATRTWEIWDISTSAYVDTGVSIDTELFVDPTLTESGYAADAKVTGDKIGELKSAFNAADFAGQSYEAITGWFIKTTDAVTNNNDGTFTIGTTDYGSIIFKELTLQPGLYSLFGVPEGFSFLSTTPAYTGAFITNSQNAEKYVPIETETVCYLGYRIGSRPDNSFTITPYLKEDKIFSNHKQVLAMQDTLTHTTKRIITDRITKTVKSKTESEDGGINANGSSFSSTGTRHLNIAVEPGCVISVQRFYLNASGVPTLITDQVMNAVCAYSGETVVPAKGKSFNAKASSYTVPDGIDNITISFVFSGTLDMAYIISTVPNGNINYYPVETTFKSPVRYRGNLTANTFQQIGGKLCIDESIVSCICPIDANFSSIKVGGMNAGGTAISAPYIEVTPTQVKMYSNIDSSYNKSVNHGLTIANDLQIMIITKKDSFYTKVIVQSSGSRWENGDDWRFGPLYHGYGVISASTITGIDVSVSVRDLYKPVWVCGDSWVTFYDARWYGQAIALNIVNFLHSGHAGEGSADGLEHLKTLLAMYTPKMIVWLYGMNDADTNDSTPNTAWQTALNELKTICENMTIELVLATIPTTPSINNNAKNAVVTASGYRYVDEVSAMGADTSGNWIAGYQSQDGNHTTEAGARALLAQVIADVPEIALS